MITHSASETRALGKKLAAHLKPGDTVILQGELGSGKSEFARGVARGLGVEGPVPSPSFTILNAYDEGRIPFYHFDWYRISTPEEIPEMGMDELLSGGGVSMIEWSERAPEYLPEKLLAVRLRWIDEETREILFEPMGGFLFQEDWLS